MNKEIREIISQSNMMIEQTAYYIQEISVKNDELLQLIEEMEDEDDEQE